MAKQKSVLQEEVANTKSTLNFSDSKLFEKEITTKLEAALELLERRYQSRMEATSRQHMETRYLLQEQLTRSKDKCVLLEKELVNLNKKNQDSKGLEDHFKRYHDQWQNTQKMVDLHQRTIQHLSSTIDVNNGIYEGEERILQQKLSDGKRRLTELRERYLDNYQQTIQHSQTDYGRNRQEIQKLQPENHKVQQIIQKLQPKKGEYLETIQQLQMDSRGHQEHIQELNEVIEDLLERKEKLETEASHHQTEVSTLQEMLATTMDWTGPTKME